jgi:hypothetical protein
VEQPDYAGTAYEDIPGASRLRGAAGGTLPLSRVDFLGAMRDFLLSRALLPLIPPTPFSHKGRRGLLGVLMAETKDGTQGLKKPTPVRDTARAPTTGHTLGARASRLRGAAGLRGDGV